MATTLPVENRSVTREVPLELTDWWTQFNDRELNSLIGRAAAQNINLRAAADRIRQARSSLQVSSSGLFPLVDATGQYRRSHTIGAGGKPPDNSVDFFQGGFDASWELDVFGGLRRGIESADAAVGSAVEDRRDALVSLLAEIAEDYISLRGYQEEIAIARHNLDAQQHTESVTKQRIIGGFAASLDIANAQAEVSSTAAQLPVFETEVEQTIFSLSVLLGQEPDALEKELLSDAPIPTTPPEIPIGLPSDLLRRRPDIRRAERQLASATANIGVATAQLFPSFSLVGDLGLQNQKFTNSFNLGSRYWSIGPSVSWPIFDAGAIRANIDISNSLQRQALAVYQQAVLQALQDVKSALVAYAKEQVHRKALADTVEANQRALHAATILYQNGATNFLNVLDAERSLLASQDALVRSDAAVSTDLVSLYKALGGGWQSFEPGPAAVRPIATSQVNEIADQSPATQPSGQLGPPAPSQ